MSFNALEKLTTALFVTVILNSVSVQAAPTATQLVFTTQPINTLVGIGVTNVVVQLADKGGTNVAQSGIAVTVTLSKGSGLNGMTNVTTDVNGRAAFNNLLISFAGNGDTLTASSTG
jgi:hypothetical protein